jgi:hypothetical protein
VRKEEGVQPGSLCGEETFGVLKVGVRGKDRRQGLMRAAHAGMPASRTSNSHNLELPACPDLISFSSLAGISPFCGT